ncbi:dTDP-4-dehydrorhamnose reductase [Rhodobium orientis]|uniref:dTDP-4-dehydrorhamnose reductase n=1 Tax=Rhodobium orientis TaxID=34017 RepID=A0A327JHT5_9HYPH|nr:dTDP-4-dehydrorhamnose reductase [Rhodobium orientis]MBB4305331.1 dTDP-4-dehydrorhamnose reductase [Rhodobium orientis]MBK5949926.1 dTDP-4-dehydrorhamnose reductase [Rhodobium orientis]RAI25541.1 dTDP-4-dehydrorhamnose reductase [Rhodobium orientis]
MGARVLVIGKSGQVATALLERAEAREIPALCVGRPEVDIATMDTLPHQAAAFAPTVVVNAAAYTAVDKAEDEEDAAFAVNAEGAGRVASAAAKLGVPVIHISTDYVYDGAKTGPYVETDSPRPLGVYGRAKLAGEEAVAKATDRHVILRTAWVFSPFGRNFVRTMLTLAETRDRLKIVDDQRGSPTYALDLADAILTIAERIAETGWQQRYQGVFHAANAGETTWRGLAREAFAASAALGGPTAAADPIPTADYPTPAVRPLNSRLDCGKLKATFGIDLPDWWVGVRDCVGRIVAEKT